ncbi:MAG: hypothetical protein GY835_16915 [bacterium]|nr:hypothetical protein [bacterium]
MKKVMLTLAVLFLMTLAGTALAEHSVWGLMQTWYTYTGYDAEAAGVDVADDYEAKSQSAFGLKRGFFGAKYKDGDFKASLFVNATPTETKLIDMWIELAVNEQFSIRAGRFAGWGAQSVGLTSSAALDLVQRPIAGLKWASALDRGAGRTIGLQATVKPNDKFKAGILLSSPDVKASVVGGAAEDDVVDSGMVPQIDLGVCATPMEGLKIGGSYGLANEKLCTTGNMTAFGYYSQELFFAKVDYIMLMNNPDWDEDDADFTSMGFAVTGGYNVNEQVTLVGRYETWDGNTDTDIEDAGGDAKLGNISFGVNYAFKTDNKFEQRLQFAFTRRMDETADDTDLADPNVIQAVWQILFK